MTDKQRQRLQSWQDEIAQELVVAREKLTALQSEHEAAAAAARSASALHRAARAALTAITEPRAGLARVPLAAPLLARLNSDAADAQDAERRVLHTHGQLEAQRLAVAELERALAQLDELLPAAAEAAA